MNNKAIILIIAVLLASLRVFSQAVFNQNLYVENKYPINPAYAGSQNMIEANIDYKDLSTSLYGSPKFLAFGINSPIYKKMSLGMRINKQSEGLINMLSGFADYSYLLQIKEKHKIRFGISLGFISNHLDNSRIIAEDPSAIIDIASKSLIGFAFQSAAGIVYNWNNFECSFSTPQLFESKKTLSPSFSTLMQYYLRVKNQNIALKPSFFVRYKSNSPTLYDLNLQTYWKDQFWVGIGYRNSPGFIASAGVRFSNLKIAYAIELAADKYSNMNSQVHEVSISYVFQKKKKIPIDSTYSPNNLIVAKNKLIDTLGKTATDSAQISSKVKIIEQNEDSLIINNTIDSINKPNIEIVEEGNGVFIVKTISNQGDSTSKSVEITEQMLDSLLNSDVILGKIIIQKAEYSNLDSLEDAPLYTIQLYIDKSNDYLLKNTEIVSEARVEKSANGDYIYLFGFYNSKEEVLNANKNFKKYKDLKTKILPIKSN